MTVLFADVVRSMDLAAVLDMERLRDVMTGLMERAAAVVHRYGGRVELTGDGVMAIFGAPTALEDHAFRACVAALAIQDEVGRLAVEVRARDGVELQVRVGLNSGRVIAGQVGPGYAATGQQVGMAQRMESVAPPGGVMLSEATAALVEDRVVLVEPEWVRIKGATEPVSARRLVSVHPRDQPGVRVEASLVGRRWEMAALEALVDRTIRGRGGVVNVVGPPGIGKSRAAREVAGLASDRGMEVVWAFCESHASDVPFYAVSRLLRAAGGVAELDDVAARSQLRSLAPVDTDPQDLLLLDDLLGVADPGVESPRIDPEARKRRLTALVNAVTSARTQPTLYVIEDAHWIDAVSESMIADLLAVIPGTPSMALITYRPEYRGLLPGLAVLQTIVLAPLADSDTAALVGELLGADPSVEALAAVIAGRAAGNPFFAEEMVRELAQRGVLTGGRGDYRCDADAGEVSVPATVQAAIAARIDRLGSAARRALNAASVIGARFGAELLAALDVDAAFDELLDTELIDQVRYIPDVEYAFRHPLIRTVAYESQLKSDRAGLHRRLGAVIESGDPAAAEENAALIAEHLEAAGDLGAAFGWHMRAAGWSTNRDVDGARISWERARRIADQLPTDDPSRLPMQIAPRAMLCATDYQNPELQDIGGYFAELHELCGVAGDKASLAIGMAGPITKLHYIGRSPEGTRLISTQIELLESMGDPTFIMGLSAVWFNVWADAGEVGEILRWSQTVIDLADGDRTKGATLGLGSPLAIALAWRGNARWWLGCPGWRQDIHDAVEMARSSDPTTFGAIVSWIYNLAMDYGVLRADDSTMRLLEEAREASEFSPNIVLKLTEYTLGIALLCQDDPTDHDRGLNLMVSFREFIRKRAPFLTPVAELWIAREQARRGEREAAILLMRQAANEIYEAGRLGYGQWGLSVLAEALIERGGDGDLIEAEEMIDRLAHFRADRESAVRDITLMKLRMLLARASGDIACQDLARRYLELAKSRGYEVHIDWAEAMFDRGCS